MTSCRTCQYRDRRRLEADIAAQRISIRAAAKQVGVSKTSLSQHMENHVSKKVAKAAEANELQEGLSVVNALTESRARILAIYEKAMDSDDLRAAVSALQTEVSQLSLMGKITGQFSDQSQVNVLVTSDQDEKIMAVIYHVLEPYPEIRLQLSEALDQAADAD
jgi:predicted ArsR family transcriptional regulator